MPELTDLKELPEIGREVTRLARDAAYVVVGLGVLGFQRAQVQRHELRTRLEDDLNLDDRLGELRDNLNHQIHQLDELLEGAVHFVESTLEPLEDQLPPAARDLAKRAHFGAREVRSQLRSLMVPA